MRPPSRPLRTATAVLVAWCSVSPPRAPAGEWTDTVWRGLSRASSHQRARPPATQLDCSMERLAGEIDWLEKYINSYGSIVAKHPDVWGQSRLTRHRAEFEKTLVAQLDSFKELNNGSLRRSDQSFLGMAMALQSASQGQAIPGTAAGSPTASAINLVSTGTAGDGTPIFRSAPFATTGTAPFASFGLGDGNAIALEPSIHLDHLAGYVKHLQELRRINEGDDNSDSPGYALNLVRIPVSILPGQYTQRGHGAEITVTADLVLGEDLLPVTFRSLVINDLVDTIAPSLTFAVNDPAARNTAWRTIHREALEERVAQATEALAIAEADRLRAEEDVRHAQEALAALQRDRRAQGAVATDTRQSLVEAARLQVADLLETDEAKGVMAAIKRYARGPASESAPEGGTSSAPDARISPEGARPPAPAAAEEPSAGDVAALARRLVDELLVPPSGVRAFDAAPRPPVSRAAEALLGKAREAIAVANADLLANSRDAVEATSELDQRIGLVEGAMRAQQDQLVAAEGALDEARRRQATARANATDVAAVLAKLRTRLSTLSPAVVPSTKSRRSRLPVPSSQLTDVGGIRQVALLIDGLYNALASHPANRPCIDYNDVCGLLGEELQAAYDLLSQPSYRGVWESLPSWNLGELVRTRRFNELERRRCEFFMLLGGEPAGAPADGGAPRGVPCCNDTACHAVCRSVTGVLAWTILVESALLNERLGEDMREAASAQGRVAPAPLAWAGPFYGPDPSPQARAAFNDYVRLRWPIRIFALDPVVQEQNIEDMYSKQRELQITMALATAGGRLNAQAASRYARRLETDMATIALNKTAVAFSHGSDTFGWRFYPRFQSPPTRNNIAAFADTLVGSNSQRRDLAERRIEPGIRECTAIVVMPSFVPYVNFDVRTNWFALNNPKHTDQNMRQTLQLSRSIKAMQLSATQCAQCAGAYRDGEVARLLRRVEQLDRELPLQSMLTQIPYENTSGGFELFTTGITDLAPELVGWYGSPGIDPASETTLFLVGKGFSVLDTQVVAGGKAAAVELISRHVMRVTIPAGAHPIRRPSATDCSCPPAPPPPCPPAPSTARAARPSGGRVSVVRATQIETLPPPGNPLRGDDSVLVPGCPPATIGFGSAPPAPPTELSACPDGGFADEFQAGCGRDCIDGLFVDVHLATPYGVSGHLLIPVLVPAPPAPPSPPGPPEPPATLAPQTCSLDIDPPTSLALTASRTGSGTWRVNEYYDAVPDEIRIVVPTSFAAPPDAEIRWSVRDSTTDPVVGTFTIPAPHYDAARRAYVFTGGELRNFIGDTSRPATDKTLRGAIKPYLDFVGSRVPADDPGAIARDLVLTAELVSGQQVIPIGGAIAIAVRHAAVAGDDR
ncbi:MAG: cell envelope integrity protein TolA [Planctomycetaceae bacterium]